MKITVNSKILSAVQAAIDPKDTRAQLRGFYIDTSTRNKPMIVGTNGKVMVSAEVDILSNDDTPSPKESIFYPVKVNSRARDGVAVIIDTAEKTATIGGKTQNLEQPTTATAYPDWRRIRADYDTDNTARKTIGRVSFDVSLIEPISRALKSPDFHNPVIFTFGESEKSPIKVSWSEYPSIDCILMPCRI